MLFSLKRQVRRARVWVACRTVVLAYHHVTEATGIDEHLRLPPGIFRQQMEYVARRRWALPLSALLNANPPRRPSVVISFDDAALDFYVEALPILKQLGIPATVFIPTGLIGDSSKFWWNRLYRVFRAAKGMDLDAGQEIKLREPSLASFSADRLWQGLRCLPLSRMNELLVELEQLVAIECPAPSEVMSHDQLQALDHEELVSFGAHSVSHRMMSRLSADECLREVQQSRDALCHLRSFIPVFAYPYGDSEAIGDHARNAVKQAGMKRGFTLSPGTVESSSDPYTTCRVSIGNGGLNDFRWRLEHFLGRS